MCDIDMEIDKILYKGFSHKTALFHYTSAAGLSAIINSKKIWVSHLSWMNDYTEYELSLDSLLKNIFQDDISSKFVLWSNKQTASKYVYGLSFSKEQDNLHLWNSYTKNDGYNFMVNLGNFRNSLIESIRDKYILFDGRVIYTESDREKIIELFRKKYQNIDTSDDYQMRLFQTQLIGISFLFKKKIHKIENEYRFVFIPQSTDNNSIQFRERNSYLVPYIELELPRKIIKKITIGPKVGKEIGVESLRSIFSKDHIDIDVSQLKLLY